MRHSPSHLSWLVPHLSFCLCEGPKVFQDQFPVLRPFSSSVTAGPRRTNVVRNLCRRVPRDTTCPLRPTPYVPIELGCHSVKVGSLLRMTGPNQFSRRVQSCLKVFLYLRSEQFKSYSAFRPHSRFHDRWVPSRVSRRRPTSTSATVVSPSWNVYRYKDQVHGPGTCPRLPPGQGVGIGPTLKWG